MENSEQTNAFWSNIFRHKRKNDDSILARLRQVPIFEGLNRSQLGEFEKIVHRRTYRAEEAIFYEGEPGVGMYVINRGRVGIFKDDARREKLAELETGDFFGEMALLDDSPRSASAIALEDCEVLGIFRPDILELLDRRPALGKKVLLQLAIMVGERLRRTNNDLQRLRSTPGSADGLPNDPTEG